MTSYRRPAALITSGGSGTPEVSASAARFPSAMMSARLRIRGASILGSDGGTTGAGCATDEGSASGKVMRPRKKPVPRSEEHTSELQSLMRISYAVFCLKKKTSHSIKDMLIYNISMY